MMEFANGIKIARAKCRAEEFTGLLSKKTFKMPDRTRGYPLIDMVGGKSKAAQDKRFKFDPEESEFGYPDTCSAKREFALLIPSTNTTMESELWSIICKNQDEGTLNCVGLHTTNVTTAKPQVSNAEEVAQYKEQFLGSLGTAVQQALHAEPEYLIMGMSMEHILHGLENAKEPFEKITQFSKGLGCASWHEAAKTALTKLGARKISVLTPFDKSGMDSAKLFFEDMGFEVENIVGMACASAIDIAHVPDKLKIEVIKEELLYCTEPKNGGGCASTTKRKVDAIVQCGTNFSLCQVAETLEPEVEIPILGITATLFWYALRETGIDAKLVGGGDLPAFFGPPITGEQRQSARLSRSRVLLGQREPASPASAHRHPSQHGAAL